MTPSRIFLYVLLAFLAGVGLRSLVAIPLTALWFALIGGFILAGIGALRHANTIVIAGALILALIGGMVRFAFEEYRRPDVSRWHRTPVVLGGTVWEEPRESGAIQRLAVMIEKLEGAHISPRVLVSVVTRRFPSYRIGEEVIVEGIWEAPSAQTPLLQSRSFFVSTQTISPHHATLVFPRIVSTGAQRGRIIHRFLSDFKRRFEANIDRVVPDPHAAFLKGIVLGERESLSRELREELRKTGTTHVIALSGYNITLVSEFLISLLILATLPFTISFWVAAALIVLFVMMTGASPSVVRAGIMGILALTAQRVGRRYSMTNALAFAATGMVIVNPALLRFDAAFQLSFLATMGLVYLAPRTELLVERIRNRIARLWQRKEDLPPLGIIPYHQGPQEKPLFLFKKTLVETLAAQLMVLPLLIAIFGQVSLISPLTNVLILMAVPYTMTLGFITGFLGFLFEPLSQVSGWISWVLLEYQLRVIGVFAKVPAASVKIQQWMLIPLFAGYAWFFWRTWRSSRRKQQEV